MVAFLEPGDAFLVGGVRLGVKMCVGSLASWSRSSRSGQKVWRQGAGGEAGRLAVGGGDGVAERPADPQVVLGVAGLADADGDPALVGQPAPRKFHRLIVA